MILLREIHERDLDALERFAQIPGFINLPNDRELLRDRIQRSMASFRDELPNKMESKYIFVAEDLSIDSAIDPTIDRAMDQPKGQVFGTSMIAAQHGTEESPHFYFEVGSEEKFSATINTGFIHGTLKLKYDSNGPSEIGGLVIDPQYRNNPEERVGRQISFVRFLYLALNKTRFKKKLIAELLPPLNKKGQSPLWEAIGRRFTNMDYWEADQLCQKNKEFIFSLFPSGKIYTSFLAAEARNAIGKVGKETEPVLHMLNKIGFKYRNQVDPFDGGPHLIANVDEILPVKRVIHGVLADFGPPPPQGTSQVGLLTRNQTAPAEFRATTAEVVVSGTKVIHLVGDRAASVMKILGLKTGDPLAFMTYY